MEKQEKNQLKDLLKKYLDSTPMDSNQSSSANNIINMLDDSSTNEHNKETVFPSVEDYLTAVELYEKLFGDDSGKKLTSHELSKELEEATNFLNHVTHMCAKAFNIDESELEDHKGNEDSDNKSSKENLDNEEDYDDSVSVFDLDIKEADDISDKSNIGGAVTNNWASLEKYSAVLPINNHSKYHAKFKEDILKLSDNYVKVINERDSKVANVLSTVKSA